MDTQHVKPEQASSEMAEKGVNPDKENKLEAMGAGLAEFALRRPVTVCMFFASMLLLGIISSRLLRWNDSRSKSEIYIVVPYADASPAEVEKMITRPVEEVLATMSGIERSVHVPMSVAQRSA